MATLTSSSSSSPRCVPFAFRRERRARGLPAAGAHATGPTGCGRPLCRAAEVVGGGIRGAFFASLDRCSCVEVRTKHDDDSAPLMRGGGRHGQRRCRLRGDGARLEEGGSKQRRGGGLGCCDASSTRTVN